MRYSYDYKRKAVELYRQGLWPDTPNGINAENFHGTVRKWVRIEDACGPDALRHNNFNKVWTPEEKLSMVYQVLAGNSIKSIAYGNGIDTGALRQWVRKFKIYGYNGLIDKKKGRNSNNPDMKKKALENLQSNPQMVLNGIKTMIHLNNPIVISYYSPTDDLFLYKSENEALRNEKNPQSGFRYCSAHYMIIVGYKKIYDENNKEVYLLEVESNGQIYYVNYSEYAKFLSSQSNMLEYDFQ